MRCLFLTGRDERCYSLSKNRGRERMAIEQEVVDIIAEKNILIVKGCIPGAPNSYLEIIK